MARIIDIVRARKDEIATDVTKASTTGELSLAAVLAGINSPEWEDYMAHLGPLEPHQLARLLAKDSTEGNLDMDMKRAYVVTNGLCGPNSPMTQNLDFQVDSIDLGLPEGNCDLKSN